MKLNVKAVLAQEAERKAKPKPLPVVKVKLKTVAEAVKEAAPVLNQFAETKAMVIQEQLGNTLLTDLINERTRLLKERAVLSSGTAHIVADIEASLRHESQQVANEFLKGDLPMPELIAHYAAIEKLTEQGAKLYDDIEHVKRYGKLPEAPAVQLNIADISDEAKVLKYEIRTLGKFISKTEGKMNKASAGIKGPKNSDRINTWKTKIALAEVKLFELKTKLKDLSDGRK